MTTEEPDNPPGLLDRLVSRDLATRLDAEREVRRMDAEQIGGLLAELKAHERRRSLGIYAMLALGNAAVLAVIYLCSMQYGDWFKVWGPYLLPLIFCWPYSIAFFPARKRRAVLHALEGIDNVQALPGLMRLLNEREVSDRAAQIRPLIALIERLLPDVTAEQFLRWSAKDRAALRYPLRMGVSKTRVSLQLAILKLLERAGDETDIPDVTMLIRITHNTTPEARTVVEAAKICLEYLGVRSREKELSRTLLRGSQAGSASPAELLRPARSESGESADTLLRAAESAELPSTSQPSQPSYEQAPVTGSQPEIEPPLIVRPGQNRIRSIGLSLLGALLARGSARPNGWS